MSTTATAEDPAVERGVVEVLVVRIDDDRYALELGRLRRIADRPPTTRVPGTPTSVDGVARIKGRVTVIVDPRPTLEPDAGGIPPDDARVVILRDGEDGEAVGALVDRIEGFRRYRTERIQPGEEAGNDGNGDTRTEADADKAACTAHPDWRRAVIEPSDAPDDPLPVVDTAAIVAGARR